jgi:hypothetical protein
MTIIIVFKCAAVLMAYFIPAVVASCREHNNTMAIFVFNFLLGWTGFFWIIALVWSCTNNVRKEIPNKDLPVEYTNKFF